MPKSIMPVSTYDVLVISDFRFPGGTSSAIAEELKANAAAGYRTALLHVEASNLTYPFAVNPRIRACLDSRLADLIDPDGPVSAGLVLVHNPFVFNHLPARPLSIEAETKLLVVHHPAFDADGEPYYNVAAVDLHAQESLGGGVRWTPVGPRVRDQLEQMAAPPPLHPCDWYNVIDPGLWHAPRPKHPNGRPVIGRHSRPDRRKWPDTRDLTLAAYPDDVRFQIRVLGGGPFLLELVGAYPRSWRVWPFNGLTPQAFLPTIDFFVYFHHSRWVEAFGFTVVEAMASGAVAILPPHFRSLFGDAALYCEPNEVGDRVVTHHLNRDLYREQSERGREMVCSRFSHEAHTRRLHDLIGPPRRSAYAVSAAGSRRPRRVLFLSSNGVGMGHLARLLAIARRCREPLRPVFATMSQAMSVVRQYGFHAEYLPEHRYLGADTHRWNKFLRHEINELLAFYDPSVVVFDCNCPYQGVIDTISDNPEAWFIWCRRGMWRPGAGKMFVERERHFDAVLEPGDLADAFDHGLTAQSRSLTRSVAPIRLLDDDEMLPRDEARRELGLDAERPAVLLQLGSGNNYDFDTVRKLALAHLAKRGGVQVAVAEWLMADRTPDLPDGVLRLRRFPLGRWLKAFDFTVSAVGYNSFHELLFAAIPTVFVPNENPQQDDQLTRARYAERHGLGLCVRAHEVYRLGPALDRLLDPEERAAIRARCAALEPENGAVEAARMIEELAFMRRADRGRR